MILPILILPRFQWVALLIRTLPQITEDIPDWLKSLPRGLPEAYTRVFDEIEVLGGSKPKIAQRTFDWMIGCFEPLHQDALVEFARRNPNGDGVEYSSLTIDIVLDAYRNLLVVDRHSKCCRFSHLSVREFLESTNHQKDQPVFDCYIHNQLALVTLGSILEDNNGLYLTEGKRRYLHYQWRFDSLRDVEPCRVYATKFWPCHAKIAFATKALLAQFETPPPPPQKKRKQKETNIRNH